MSQKRKRRSIKVFLSAPAALFSIFLILTSASILNAAAAQEGNQKNDVKIPLTNMAATLPASKISDKAGAGLDLAKDETVAQQRKEVEKIQNELRGIIQRTHQLQDQVRDNRLEIQRMMDRAQIHERILKTISLPTRIQTKQQIISEDIVRREKMRVISNQANQAQQQLQVLQQVKSAKTTAKQETPVNPKPSKSS